MKFLPFENITYKSQLDSEEILRRIDGIIEPERTFRLTGVFGSQEPNRYEGSITENSFSIMRIISYKNSFLPRIKGVVEEGLDGRIVRVKMRLHNFVFAFMLFWLGVVGITCLGVLVSMLGNQDLAPQTLIPFFMFIFGYALVTGGFKYESIKSRKFLADLFEAEVENKTRYRKS